MTDRNYTSLFFLPRIPTQIMLRRAHLRLGHTHAPDIPISRGSSLAA